MTPEEEIHEAVKEMFGVIRRVQLLNGGEIGLDFRFNLEVESGFLRELESLGASPETIRKERVRIADTINNRLGGTGFRLVLDEQR